MLVAEVVLVGAPPGIERLTYAVPPPLAAALRIGHRVLVPLRGRKLTGVVIRVLERPAAPADDGLKPLASMLEQRPLFDSAHLKLLEFASSYYIVPLTALYRSLVPAGMRIESRKVLTLARAPNPLENATFARVERLIVEELEKRPAAEKQVRRKLARMGAGDREIAAALGRLDSWQLLERREAVLGHHRDDPNQVVAHLIGDGLAASARAPRQRRIVEFLANAPGQAASLTEIEAEIPGARVLLNALVRKGILTLENKITVARRPAAGPALTIEQNSAVAAIAAALEAPRFETFLLWGITGSGKTEVYMRLAEQSLAARRPVLILVPEIALADQLVFSFRARFGALVAVAHSAQSVTERWSSWQAAISGQAQIVIGPRSAIFAPITNLGLIVVDEEHDGSYKSEEGVHYNARDLSVALGNFSCCPVILGSATPAAESFANARSGRYQLLKLTRRIADRPMAQVQVVDLRAALEKKPAPPAPGRGRQAPASAPDGPCDPANPFAEVPISPALREALKENLAAHGQSLIFMNRRGYHNFLQCHLCGAVPACPNCSVSLTFHLLDRTIRCHWCGECQPAPERCQECGGLGLQGQGFGTERLAAALGHLVPNARIARMDSDTSGRRGARTAIIEQLRGGEIDVLVGTQMITKGFDLPGVTLVGVIMADLSLNIPDFRSAERTFQVLTQVAGRAGRGETAGRVIIQTYAPHHYSIRCAADQDYGRFIRRELQLRRELGYPPYGRLALVRVEGPDADEVEKRAALLGKSLEQASTSGGFRVLGPAPAPIEKIKRRYRWQLMVKASTVKSLRAALEVLGATRSIHQPGAEQRTIVDIDPVNMM